MFIHEIVLCCSAFQFVAFIYGCRGGEGEVVALYYVVLVVDGCGVVVVSRMSAAKG